MKFSICQETRQGTRKNNEDRVGYAYSRAALLMVVADGMGGHLHGEVASHIAVQFLLEAFRREAAPALRKPPKFLEDSIVQAHHALLDYARGRRLPEAPKTTIVACIVQHGSAWWAHVGDSRLYHLRGASVRSRTRDHSMVQLLVDEGRLREEAMSVHPDRNRVLNCLGAVVPPRVELSDCVLLHGGDTLLLCTDGFWGPLSNALICQAFVKDEVSNVVPRLLDAAEKRAGRDCDNLSVVAITWADDLPTTPYQISTRTLPPEAISTQLQDFGDTAQLDLTDEEIERAIAEIRAAIRRNTPR